MVGVDALKPINFIIGICAHNEKSGIKLLLSRLLSEVYRNNLNAIVIVSTTSIDGTNEIVQSFSDSRIKLLVEDERLGKYTAVNKIISYARSNLIDVIVMIPADVLPMKGSIDTLVSEFLEEQVGCVSARPIVMNNNGVMGKIGNVLWEMHHETFLYHKKQGTVTHATGEMMAVRTKAVDYLPRIIVDDAYMASTALQKGFKVEYEPNAKVLIWVPTKIKDLWTQRKRNLQGLKHLRNLGLPIQTLTYANPSVILLMMFKSLKKNPRFFPFLVIIGIIELLGGLFANLSLPQKIAWDMISTAKPRI